MKYSTKQSFIVIGVIICVGLYFLSGFIISPHKSDGFAKVCAENWNKHNVTSSVGAADPLAMCTCISDHMSRHDAELVHFTTIYAWFIADKPNISLQGDTLFGKESDDLFMNGLLYCVNNQ